MDDQSNVSLIVIISTSIGGVTFALFATLMSCLLVAACVCSSKCKSCPCNRIRGQAQLQLAHHGADASDSDSKKSRRSRSTVVNVDIRHGEQQSVSGVKMYKRPSEFNKTRSTTSVSTPEGWDNSTLGSYPSPSSLSSSPFTALSPGISASTHSLLHTPSTPQENPPRESCIYVIPNDALFNDGSERSTSWGLCVPNSERTTSDSADLTHEVSRTTVIDNLVCIYISRSQAETVLNSDGHIETFLIRLSTRAHDQIGNNSQPSSVDPESSNCYDNVIISALAADATGQPTKYRHLLVVKDPVSHLYKIESLLSEDENMFATLQELIQHFSTNEIHFQDGGASILLLNHLYN